VALALTAAALAVTAAGCTSSSGGSAGSVPIPAATRRAVSAQPTSLGTILVDGQGRTVYEFANDVNGASTCTNAACRANWPFVPCGVPERGTRC
jgi:predicted lipoprotein with Yx(FWY)xxD motif